MKKNNEIDRLFQKLVAGDLLYYLLLLFLGISMALTIMFFDEGYIGSSFAAAIFGFIMYGSLRFRINAKKDKAIFLVERKYRRKFNQAKEREKHLDYKKAKEIYEEIGRPDQAARIRTLEMQQNTVNVAQKVVHGDEVTKTEIKDSVLNRSNVGTNSEDKFAKLERLTEMKKEGLISDEEYDKMKQEIIG